MAIDVFGGDIDVRTVPDAGNGSCATRTLHLNATKPRGFELAGYRIVSSQLLWIKHAEFNIGDIAAVIY